MSSQSGGLMHVSSAKLDAHGESLWFLKNAAFADEYFDIKYGLEFSWYAEFLQAFKSKLKLLVSTLAGGPLVGRTNVTFFDD